MTQGAAAQDLQLWHAWDTGGRKMGDLEPLLDRLDPLIHNQVGQYAGRVNIPGEAIRSKAEDLAIHGIQTFDPGKGTQLSTHVFGQLRGLNRFITTYQNPARIPQHQVHRINELMTLRDRMTADLGRPPTDYALAKKMNWSPRQVASLTKGLTRRVLDPELFKLKDPRSFEPSRFREVVDLLPTELTPREQFVFKSIYGIGGPPQSATQIARKIKASPATVSRIRKRVASTISHYLNTREP